MIVTAVSMNTKGAVSRIGGGYAKGQNGQYTSIVSNSTDTSPKSVSFGALSKKTQEFISQQIQEGVQNTLKKIQKKEADDAAKAARQVANELARKEEFAKISFQAKIYDVEIKENDTNETLVARLNSLKAIIDPKIEKLNKLLDGTEARYLRDYQFNSGVYNYREVYDAIKFSGKEGWELDLFKESLSDSKPFGIIARLFDDESSRIQNANTHVANVKKIINEELNNEELKDANDIRKNIRRLSSSSSDYDRGSDDYKGEPDHQWY